MNAKESRRLLLGFTALALVASLASIDAKALTASLVSAAKEYQQEHQTLLALLAVPTMALWVVAFVPSTPYLAITAISLGVTRRLPSLTDQELVRVSTAQTRRSVTRGDLFEPW